MSKDHEKGENLDEGDNVRVVVRVRPMNEKELAEGYRNIVTVDTLSGTIWVENPNVESNVPPKKFTFDLVFTQESKQVDIYNQAARPIVENVLEGYNGTIFAYGQTGTGKTFTMEGNRNVPELKGIIPNSFANIFGHIAKAEGDKKFLVRVSYLEIYNEEVRDLLGKDQTARLEVKERPDIGVYVKDLSSYVVNNADDMDRIMTLGNKNRVVGATKMNACSSRSHAIFTITVEAAEKGLDGNDHVRVGKLHLVDLAGSERQSKTGATGQRLKEASKINLSLSTLGNVISALVDGKSTHIPYRNSKLTRLLQDSLGGNSRTVMCANFGPAEYNYEETISTLRYAQRAKSIKNRARINEDPKDALLRQFQEEIEELRRQLEEAGGTDGVEKEGSGEEDVSEETSAKESLKAEKMKAKQAMAEQKKMEMQAQIETERKVLRERKDINEEEKKKIELELQKREKDLETAESEQQSLKEKLQALERKILVGGENLLEKAEAQERLLAESAMELEERKMKEEQLKQALLQREAERVDIEERYSSLQEEAAGKSKKLRKVWSLLLAARAELADVQHEHQREMEGLLDSVRQLTKEMKMHTVIVDHFIPQEYQDMVERYVHWNEDIGEWQLKCVAYTGNNMRKLAHLTNPTKEKEFEPDLSSVYLSYNPERLTNAVKPPRGARVKSSRSQLSARPKSSRKPI